MRPTPLRILTFLLLIVLPAASTAPATAADPALDRPHRDFDVRAGRPDRVSPAPEQLAALAGLPGVAVRWNERLGVPGVLFRPGGYLSGPGTDPVEFLLRLAPVMGLSSVEARQLVPAHDYRTRHNGARHLEFRQFAGGVPVHGSLVKMTLDREGRVVIVGGLYHPGLGAPADARIGAEEAVERAAGSVGARPWRRLEALPDRAGPAARRDERGPRRAVFRNDLTKRIREPREITAERVVFPMGPAEPARPGWRISLETDSGWYDMVVDAVSGEVLSRSAIASYAAEGSVFTVQSPPLGSPEIVPFTGESFDNAGWVADRTTAGNNCNVYTDVDNDNVPDYQPETPPPGDPDYQRFIYPFTDAYATSGGTDIMTDRDASVTQAFYWINWLHDYFYRLGFDEAARNFQDDNFGRGGAGGDGMLVEVHNGFGVGNNEPPNTQVPADGSRPRMSLWAALRDGAMDGDLIAHEYTHGVGNRLTNGENLPFGVQTWALGEGWSDFFGTSIFDDPIAGEYGCGNATTGCPNYAYDNSPLVYSDLCAINSSGCEPHADGEIFTAALWDLRFALAFRYGPVQGKKVAEQMVIDGMKSTPCTPNVSCTPNFLDARDGILAADMATFGGTNQCAIWAAFAGREMGVSAATAASQQTVTPATDVPSSCLPTADAGGPYMTDEGIDAALDGSASDPGSDASTPAIDLYEWDLDNDGDYDDALGATATFDMVGQDGVFTVGLRVTNSAGLSATASTSVTVANVAPAVSLAPIAAVAEGGTVSLSGSSSDPGWLEALMATVDWEDGAGALPLPGSLENFRPDATLSFSAGRTYGDDGIFSVQVCVADDDTATCASTPAVVTNVDPTAAIVPSGQSSYDGVSAYILPAGGSVDVEARSTDPGSDDLTFTWVWGDGTSNMITSLVNPPAADPLKSPSIQSRDETLTRSHTYGTACLYDLEFRSADDDGGMASDQAAVIVVGNATLSRGSGWWMNQYRPKPPEEFDPATLQCYLDIAVFMSTVFDAPLDRNGAMDILFVKQNRGTARELFDEQLLAAWLNFANGAVGLDTPVDTNGDGVADTTFAMALLFAETIRESPSASREELLAQKDILERIVLRDEGGTAKGKKKLGVKSGGLAR